LIELYSTDIGTYLLSAHIVHQTIPTIEDLKLLMTSTYTSLDASTKESFDKAIHLFATNDDVQNHPLEELLLQEEKTTTLWKQKRKTWKLSYLSQLEVG
jgi:hypothetical protein